MLPTKRTTPLNEETDDGNGSGADESKTRQHVSLPFHSYLTRPNSVCLLISTGFALILLCSFVIHRLDIVHTLNPSSNHVSRSRISDSGSRKSDFGYLGVPWCRSKQGKTVEWTNEDLIKGMEEFVPIYETRPIKNNMYGMGFDHSFGLWFITKWLKPDLMIESGAFKGHSTWVLRQAMKDKPIISLSPRHPQKYLLKGPAYVDSNCIYFAGKDFVDFGSVDWKDVMHKHGIFDLSKVVIFFDDHQNELKRLKQALKAGFRHLVFEDNYDTGIGDHYSFRQICDQFNIRGGGHSCLKDSDEARVRRERKKQWTKAVDIDELCGPGGAWWGVRGQMRDDFNHSGEAITYKQHFENSRFVESVLDVYWEVPPVAHPSLTHQIRYDPGRVSYPIIKDGDDDDEYGLKMFSKIGLSKLDSLVFNGYTQMVYVQVSDQDSS